MVKLNDGDEINRTNCLFCITASDLESIRALFNEKEKELSVAVAKVEELTLQLEELQRGRNSNSGQMPPSAAAVELEKLRSELLVSVLRFLGIFSPFFQDFRLLLL